MSRKIFICNNSILAYKKRKYQKLDRNLKKNPRPKLELLINLEEKREVEPLYHDVQSRLAIR